MKVALGGMLALGWNCCCAAAGLASSSLILLAQRRRLSIFLLFLFIYLFIFALFCRLSIIALLLTPGRIIKQRSKTKDILGNLVMSQCTLGISIVFVA